MDKNINNLYKSINLDYIYKLYSFIYKQVLKELNLNDYSQFNKIDVIHYLLNKYSIERSLNLSRYIQDILDS
ncbi:MAG: hypothetical protein ACTSVC_07970, partial [Promethearchaeota archaeon]